jgi:hypothetical protein
MTLHSTRWRVRATRWDGVGAQTRKHGVLDMATYGWREHVRSSQAYMCQLGSSETRSRWQVALTSPATSRYLARMHCYLGGNPRSLAILLRFRGWQTGEHGETDLPVPAGECLSGSGLSSRIVVTVGQRGVMSARFIPRRGGFTRKRTRQTWTRPSTVRLLHGALL